MELDSAEISPPGDENEEVHLCPYDGESAQKISELISSAILAQIDPTLESKQHQANFQLPNPGDHARSRFIDLCTGMRMQYHEYGVGQEVILLLHDLAETALTWRPVALALADLDYRVFALDLRGHGQTSRSPGGHYSAKALADDVESFILEKDLYVRPVAVVGAGLGADVAVTLGARNPRLVGVLALIDYCVDALEQLQIFPCQAASFWGPEQFVACLTAPALGPYARPGKAALTAASALLAAKKQEGSLQMRMDPRWFYTPSNPEQAQTALAELRCHVTLLRSACSQWISEDAVRGAASMACNAASWNVVPVPGVLGYPASEAPKALVKVLLEVLREAGPALLVANMETRRPELLDIRPLPQYSSLAEALKALGPREIPTREAMEEELHRLSLQDTVVTAASCT